MTEKSFENNKSLTKVNIKNLLAVEANISFEENIFRH